MNSLLVQSDKIGIIASTLCAIHCLMTPVLFVVKACSTSCCAESPIWWQSIDYIFLIISFIAIYYTTKKSSKSWVRISLWASWILLLLTIISHSFENTLFPNNFIYFPSSAIIILHFYNIKYCKCAKDSCCV